MRRTVVFLVAVALLVGTVGVSAASADQAGVISPFSVMTRNMDLGSDLGPVLGATTPAAFAQGVTIVYGEIAASNIPERAAGVAAEIAQTMPSVVNLEEVALVQRLVPTPTGLALLDQIDQLGALRSALAGLGLHYTLAVKSDEWDSIAPSDAGYYVRVLDQDAILVRSDLPANALSFANPQTGHFINVLTFPTPFGLVAAPRGWASVDLTVQGITIRVIATHLEAYSTAVAAAQAGELLAGPANTTLPVVVGGDLNSGPGIATDAYDVLTGAMTDTWVVTKPNDTGFTWALHGEDDNPYATTPDRRIDVVLERGLHPITDIQVGTTDLTPSGLFPSDHAGVVARITALR